jgi:hypothetical protein
MKSERFSHLLTTDTTISYGKLIIRESETQHAKYYYCNEECFGHKLYTGLKYTFYVQYIQYTFYVQYIQYTFTYSTYSIHFTYSTYSIHFTYSTHSIHSASEGLIY